MRSELHDILTDKAKIWLHNKVTLRGLCWATEVLIAGFGYVADGIALGCLQGRFCEYYTHGIYGERIFVFDSKVSVSDYHGSFPASGATIGNLHWIVAPRRLFKPEQILAPWGLLEQSGQGLHEIKKPLWVRTHYEHLYRISHGVLWAKHHKPKRERDKRIRASIKRLR